MTDDYTTLYTSSQLGHLEAAKILFEEGAAVKYINKVGNTRPMWAAYYGKLEIFNYFTKISPYNNIQNAIKNTALHLAADSSSVGIIKLLLDKEMSANLTNTVDSTLLYVSAQFSRLKATKYLFEEGAAINNTNKYAFTPLMSGTYDGN
jgi:ankyrin repeat protein